MSKAYRCDRCGKIFEPSKETRYFDPGPLPYDVTVEPHIIYGEGRGNSKLETKEADICPSCYSQFIDWMKSLKRVNATDDILYHLGRDEE